MSDESRSRRVVKDLPLTRLLPNILTIMSLSSGLTAIRFALQDKWESAALAIVIAGIFDVLDGRVARMLNITSKFGAELDSLSDVISFGVAPGIIMYLWALQDNTRIGWVAVLVYAVCCALRLARFNTMLESPAPTWAKSFFTGIPAPGGAGLAILPLFLSFEFGNVVQFSPNFLAVWLICIGGLMVSRVPTLALKGWRVSPAFVVPIFLMTVLLVAALITNTWLTFSCIGLFYFVSIPIGWYSYKRKEKREGTSNA